jgi:anti-sigma B factor antagonist
MKVDINEEGGLITATIEGWLDTNVAADFSQAMQPLMEKADQKIVLDCTQMEYISSSGLRTFLQLRKECAAKGGSVVIQNINEEVRKVFTMTGFFNLFDIR